MVEVELVDQGFSLKENIGCGISKDDTKEKNTTVGQKLFQARHAGRETDLDQISDELCIRPHLLTALEQDDFNKFPSACYAAGFLKNYAAYLELNVAQIITQYREEFQDSTKKVDLVFLKAEGNNNPIQQTMVSMMILSVLVVSGVWYFQRGGDGLSLALLPDVTEVTSNILVSATKGNQKPAEQPATLVEEKDQGYNLVQQANATPLAAKAKTVSGVAEQVRLTVREDVWVRIVDTDRKILVDRVLLAGEEFYVTDRAGMTLMTNNAGAVSVFVDDVVAMPLGKSGEIRDNISLDIHDLPMNTAQIAH